MATRASAVVLEAPVTPIEVFSALIELDSTPENPTDIRDLSRELAETPEDLFPILNELADAGLLDNGNGTAHSRTEWWILRRVTAETAETVLAEALASKPAPKPKRAPRKKAAPKPVAAPVEPAESQTGLTRAQVAAELPSVVLETSEPFYSLEAQKDAEIMSKGERVISEDVVKGVDPAVLLSNGLELMGEEHTDWWKPQEFESTIPPYRGPKNIPAPPAGVSPNFWELAFYANTESGRKFWADKVDAQLKAWDAEQAAQDEDKPPF